MMTREHMRSERITHRVRAWYLTILALALLLGGCDLTVVDPASVDDRDLDTGLALPAVVNGAISDFFYAAGVPGHGGVFMGVAARTDELVHGDLHVGPRLLSDGVFVDHHYAASYWNHSQAARWAAERAIPRVRNLVDDPATSYDLATVTFIAGMANKLLGDNFCDAVFDGGGLEPHTRFLERADSFFVEALAITSGSEDPHLQELEHAIHGARAQTLMMLGDWDRAVDEARKVPVDFTYSIINGPSASRTRSRFWTYIRGQERFTAWGTPFVEWGVEWSGDRTEGDPRIPYDDNRPQTTRDNRRPWMAQRKYTSTSGNIRLIGGVETFLIEAEAALVKGDYQTAVEKINELREYQNDNRPSSWLTTLPPVFADNLDDAWVLLMKERGIEFYLEGRRLADLRRWEKVPGKEKVPFKVVRQAGDGDPEDDVRYNVYEHAHGSVKMCLEISQDEKNSNPNIRS